MRNIVAGLLLLALAALFSSIGVAGPLVYRTDGLAVLLTDKPCTSAEVLAHIMPDKQGMYMQGAAQVNDRSVTLCYAKVPDEMVGEPSYFIVTEEGGFGVVPQSDFEPYTGQGPKPAGVAI